MNVFEKIRKYRFFKTSCNIFSVFRHAISFIYRHCESSLCIPRIIWLNMLGIKAGFGNISLFSTIDPFLGGKITIGERCEIHKGAMLLTYGGFISIGNDCSVNPYTILYGHGGLTIGNGVRIAAHCTIIPANHRFDDLSRPLFQQGVSRCGIIIEDDVWIGTGARILDGVTIGKGSVIGAGSVVTKSIPAYSIAVGVPARVIKKRLA